MLTLRQQNEGMSYLSALKQVLLSGCDDDLTENQRRRSSVHSSNSRGTVNAKNLASLRKSSQSSHPISQITALHKAMRMKNMAKEAKQSVTALIEKEKKDEESYENENDDLQQDKNAYKRNVSFVESEQSTDSKDHVGISHVICENECHTIDEERSDCVVATASQPRTGDHKSQIDVNGENIV